MDRTQLINEIKRLMFKNKETENLRAEAIKENMRIKTLELEKYKKMLIEVKEVKDRSRLWKTMA